MSKGGIRYHLAVPFKLIETFPCGVSENTDIAHRQTVNRNESLETEMNISRAEAKTKDLNSLKM